MSRVLVTGGAGFIGLHLVNRLSGLGHRVRILDRIPAEVRPAWLHDANIEYLTGDFLDHSLVDTAIRDVDCVFHLVSTTLPASSNLDPVFDVQSNLVGTLNLLEASLRAGVKRVIFISSGGTVYGKPQSTAIKETDPTDPICSYGIVKLTIEKYLHLYRELHGLDYLVFRLANPFGEGQRPGTQGVVAAFLQKIATGMPIEIWGDGSVVRDYIHISSAVDVMANGMHYDGKFRVFNLGSGVGRSLNDIVGALREVTGQPFECVYKDARPVDVPRNVLDISLIRREFAWSPGADFHGDLCKTWEWFRNSGLPTSKR